jgi:effector-binding domain-containing protein
MMDAQQNGNDVEIQQLKLQPILSIRKTIRIDQLFAEMGERIPALWSYVEHCGAQPAGPLFVRYHTFGGNETDLEIGIPVVEPVAGEDRIGAGELPGGPVVTTWHMGPHDKLGDAYARMAAWLKAHDREPDSAAWEVYYWIDSGQVDSTQIDPSTWRTQLIQPFK